MIRSPIQESCEEITAWIAGLQNAGNDPSALRRDRFHCQRRTDTPLASHRDSIQRAENYQGGERGCESGEQFDERIEQNINHQCWAPAEFVRDNAKQQCAERAHRQCNEKGGCDRGNISFEFGCDVTEDKNDDKEIKRIEGPTEKACQDCVALARSQAL